MASPDERGQLQIGQSEVKRTRVRFNIMIMLFISVVINYIDRANIALAAPLMSKELNLSTVQMGLIFSAFGWAYAFLQIPGGWFVDRFKPRVIYAVVLCFWSLATLAQALVRGFSALLGLRVMLGALEAPSFPINNRVVTTWFPNQERATAIGFYTSGQFVGVAFLSPVLMYIQTTYGWREMLFITGLIGVVWSVIWYAFYRDPKQHNKVNEAELAHIREGGGLVDWDEARNVGEEKPQYQLSQYKYILTNKKLWGIFVGQFCVTSCTWFFLTWFPTYLVKYRHMEFIKAGFLASLPFIAAYLGVLCSGYVSDMLIRRGVSEGNARRVPVILGLILTMVITGANFVQDNTSIVLLMTIAFFGHGLSAITWVFVSALAPTKLIGLTGGVFNFFGNMSSIFVPIIIGFLVAGGDFAPALTFVGGLALTGACCYIFLVGKVERVQIPEN